MNNSKNTQQLKMVPLKDLNLTSRFLFDEVMEDPQAHKDALSIIFGKDIPLLEQNETEKELRVSPLLRTIRMDVFSMDVVQDSLASLGARFGSATLTFTSPNLCASSRSVSQMGVISHLRKRFIILRCRKNSVRIWQNAADIISR